MEDVQFMKIFFCLCLPNTAFVPPAKLYTQKEFVMMEKSISGFHTSFYIPEIQKL